MLVQTLINPRRSQHAHAGLVRAVLAVAVDAGQVRLQRDHIVTEWLAPARIGWAAQHQHRRGCCSSQMRGAGVVGNNAACVRAQGRQVKNRGLPAQIHQPVTAGPGDPLAVLDFIRTERDDPLAESETM